MENIISQFPQLLIERYNIRLMDNGVISLYTEPKTVSGWISFGSTDIEIQETDNTLEIVQGKKFLLILWKNIQHTSMYIL